VTAKDGLEALSLLQDDLPDLMLLDIEMPRMDGFELASTLRGDARTQALPIIMITSRTGKKHSDRARELGVDRYLGKPYHEVELLESINELLGAVVN
jgi:chemosensory pili system protein ChpA (sensor histidine kinase/response regulator)